MSPESRPIMTELFMRLLQISLSASWLVLLVVVLRLLLRRWPRWVFPVLWSLVGVRLLFPVSIVSRFSLVPQVSSISFDAIVETGVTDSGNRMLSIGSLIWAVGVAFLLCYGLLSYLLLRRKLLTAIRQEDRIYRSEYVRSPFILGIIAPRIYLPFHLSQEDAAHVIAHEKAHIRRRDHWLKPAAFVLLTVYWFQPTLWLAYYLLCRDIELACDERVIQNMTEAQRAAYSQTLLTCTTNRTLVPACPLSFGSGVIGERVRSVLAYKKAKRWIPLAAMSLVLILVFGFLTDPVTSSQQEANVSEQQKMEGQASIRLDDSSGNARIEEVIPSGQNAAEQFSGSTQKEKPISFVPSEPPEEIVGHVMFHVSEDGAVVIDEGYADFEVSVSQLDENTTEYLIKPIFP